MGQRIQCCPEPWRHVDFSGPSRVVSERLDDEVSPEWTPMRADEISEKIKESIDGQGWRLDR